MNAAVSFACENAASQQARLAYWTKTLAMLDAIPFDQVSPEEKINAQVFRTSLRVDLLFRRPNRMELHQDIASVFVQYARRACCDAATTRETDGRISSRIINWRMMARHAFYPFADIGDLRWRSHARRPGPSRCGCAIRRYRRMARRCS